MKTNGKKNDLIARILPYSNTETVLPFAKMYYEVTEDGKQYLSEQEYKGKNLSFQY